jgi:hypothetical protein
MRVQFVCREHGPERLIAEAEIVFDEDTPLADLKLIGFSIWSHPGRLHVTFPSRSAGVGPQRKAFDYLRTVDSSTDPVRRVKTWILAEFEKWRKEALPCTA